MGCPDGFLATIVTSLTRTQGFCRFYRFSSWKLSCSRGGGGGRRCSPRLFYLRCLPDLHLPPLRVPQDAHRDAEAGGADPGPRHTVHPHNTRQAGVRKIFHKKYFVKNLWKYFVVRYLSKLGKGYSLLSLVNSACLLTTFILLLCYNFSRTAFKLIRPSTFVSSC